MVMIFILKRFRSECQIIIQFIKGIKFSKSKYVGEMWGNKIKKKAQPFEF